MSSLLSVASVSVCHRPMSCVLSVASVSVCRRTMSCVLSVASVSVCRRPMSCVLSVASVSGLSILSLTFIHQNNSCLKQQDQNYFLHLSGLQTTCGDRHLIIIIIKKRSPLPP